MKNLRPKLLLMGTKVGENERRQEEKDRSCLSAQMTQRHHSLFTVSSSMERQLVASILGSGLDRRRRLVALGNAFNLR